MKNIVIAFLLFFLSYSSISQNEYFPLVEENKTWFVTESGFDSGQGTIKYKCEGDTLIQDELYSIVYSTNKENPVTWTKLGYISESDDHKIYYSPFKNYDSLYFEPSLLYDFTAQINDSLKIHSFPFNEKSQIDIIITNIDSVLVTGQYRKRTWFECDSYPYSYWVEGIGSNTGLIEPGFYCTIVCPTVELGCVKKDGVTIFPDGYTGNCFIVGIDEIIIGKDIFNIFPNPSSGYINITPSKYINANMEFKLRDLSGRLILKISLNNSFSNYLPINELNSGLYIYTINESNSIVQKGKIIIR